MFNFALISTSKYHGKTADEIKAEWDANGRDASALGTRLHHDIECFYTDIPLQTPNTTPEYQYFLNFHEDHKHLPPFRTEWMIYDEQSKIAGSVDMLYSDPDNPTSLHMYDWKRCKEIVKSSAFGKSALNPLIEELPDTNYWHYCLQLNLYKYIIERNYGYTVEDMYLVVLHPNNANYQKIKVIDLQQQIQLLIGEKVNQSPHKLS